MTQKEEELRRLDDELLELAEKEAKLGRYPPSQKEVRGEFEAWKMNELAEIEKRINKGRDQSEKKGRDEKGGAEDTRPIRRP